MLLANPKDTATIMKNISLQCAFITISLLCSSLVSATPMLSSWSNSDVRNTIVSFVEDSVNPKADTFLPVPQRIATIDVDGTMWVEKPYYAQLSFLALVVEAGKMKGSVHELMALSASAFAGVSRSEYQAKAADFIFKKSLHPRYKKPQSELVYKPMVELIDFLQKNEFSVYLCTGSDEGFVRPVSAEIFSIDKSKVIGQSVLYTTNKINGKVSGVRTGVYRKPTNLGKGKVANILSYIGVRPAIAIGNSLGDKEMLEWVGSNNGLAMMVVHDDSVREYDYKEKNSKIKKAMKKTSVHYISMERDFKLLF